MNPPTPAFALPTINTVRPTITVLTPTPSKTVDKISAELTAIFEQELTGTATMTATETKQLSATSSQQSCDNALESRVKVNEYARVNYTTGLKSRLRRTPEFGDNVITLLAEGTVFLVLDGPRCVDHPDYDSDFVFWKIRVRSTGRQGWIVEGMGDDYYIEPWP